MLRKIDRASGAGFEDPLDSALGEVVKGVGSGSSGFYAGAYESVYALGQCESDLGTGDCVSCVKAAIDRSKAECGSSISSQIFLQKCYISYTYYPSGVPSNQQSFSSPGKDGQGETHRRHSPCPGSNIDKELQS